MKNKIAFIGCGNMGQALLESVLNNNIFNKKDIIVSDKRISVLNKIRRKYPIKVTSSNDLAVSKSDVILLAMKPQDLNSAFKGIKDKLKDKLIISVLAGASSSIIKKVTASKRVIRVMPNAPALCGCGITAIAVNAGLREKDLVLCEMIFKSVGDTVFIKENFLDAVTAISGSGPAYFFLLMEAMIDAAVGLGIKKPIAQRLVLQTAVGASMQSCYMDIYPSKLRKMVTSKGGTTEAALKVFKKKGFQIIVKEAIVKASKRSKELSKGR